MGPLQCQTSETWLKGTTQRLSNFTPCEKISFEGKSSKYLMWGDKYIFWLAEPHIFGTMTLHISSDFSRNHLFADNLMKTISPCYRLLPSRLHDFEWSMIWSKGNTKFFSWYEFELKFTKQYYKTYNLSIIKYFLLHFEI